MSGLGKQTNNVTFLKVKAGKFYLASDKNCENAYDNLVGTLMPIEYKTEEFDGNQIEKCYFTVGTNAGNYRFGVSVNSNSFSHIISFLKNADVSREIEFLAIPEQGIGEKINTSFLVKQDGKAMKGFFVKDTETALPRWSKVQTAAGTDLILNGKPVWDKTAFLAALKSHSVQLNEILSKNAPVEMTNEPPAATQTATGSQASTTPAPQTTNGVTKATVQPQQQANDTSEEDSLPF